MTKAAAGVFRDLADRLDRTEAVVRQRASRLRARQFEGERVTT